MDMILSDHDGEITDGGVSSLMVGLAHLQSSMSSCPTGMLRSGPTPCLTASYISTLLKVLTTIILIQDLAYCAGTASHEPHAGGVGGPN